MKLIVIVTLFLFSTIAIISCRKGYSSTIVGRWNLVKDSFFVVQPPPFFNPGSGSYIGVADDYYDFKPDGSLYLKEGTDTDTLTYEVSSDKQVTFIYRTYNTEVDSLGNIISQTHPIKSYNITSLTSTNLTLSSNLTSDILTPEGYFANMIMLSK